MASYPDWGSTFYSEYFIIFWAFASIIEWTKHGPEILSISARADGHQHQSHSPAMNRTFPLGNLPQRQLQPLSLLLGNKQILLESLPQRGRRTVSRFSSFLHCCNIFRSTHFMDPVATLSEHKGITACWFCKGGKKKQNTLSLLLVLWLTE